MRVDLVSTFDDVVGYYLAGVEGFDPDDVDSLCDPAWWPEGRYLQSMLLQAVKNRVVGFDSGDFAEFEP
jgi:hypothetical protein